MNAVGKIEIENKWFRYKLDDQNRLFIKINSVEYERIFNPWFQLVNCGQGHSPIYKRNCNFINLTKKVYKITPPSFISRGIAYGVFPHVVELPDLDYSKNNNKIKITFNVDYYSKVEPTDKFKRIEDRLKIVNEEINYYIITNTDIPYEILTERNEILKEYKKYDES